MSRTLPSPSTPEGVVRPRALRQAFHRSSWPAPLLFLGTSATFVILLGCAAQGPPRPPRIEKPEAITDLAVAQVGKTFEISFTPPLRATDGERITKPLEIRLYRASAGPNQPGPSDLASLPPHVTLVVKDLPSYAAGQKLIQVDSFSGRDYDALQGTTFFYMVQSLTYRFRHRPVLSDYSNMVTKTLLAVSGPPENLRVKPTETALELSWSAPLRKPGEAPTPAGYRVYQSLSGHANTFQPVGETPETRYAVTGFVWGQTYHFVVRGIFRDNQEIAETGDSEVISHTPRDVFPPRPPTQVSGLFTGATVELIWKVNTEGDLAGYNVYRSVEGGERKRLNQELLLTPIFRDAAIEQDRRYVYQVTAIDLTNNESTPSEEVLIETH